jgi:hypothetical protein
MLGVGMGGSARRRSTPSRRLACLLFGALAVSAGAPGSHATTTGGTAGPSLIASRIAKEIAAAKTPAARYQALLGAARILHLRTLDRRGRPIVRGGGGLAPHFFLYDVEWRAAAAARLGDRTVTFAELTSLFNRALEKGRPRFGPGELRNAVASGIKAASSNPTSASVIPLLLRELGLRHRRPYDLAKAQNDNARLDPLQSALIVADLASEIARVKTPEPDEKFCEGAIVSAFDDFRPWAKGFIIALVDKAKWFSKGVAAAEIYHASILALSVRVRRVTDEVQSTHYGPKGHAKDAGKTLRFTIMVDMRDELREGLIECGPIFGFKFPKKGPISGVGVSLPSEVEGTGERLGDHGKITWEPKDGRTDKDGKVSVLFTPKAETRPGKGPEFVARGPLRMVARYQSALGNVTGFLGQFITPKQGLFTWTVRRHELTRIEVTISGSTASQWDVPDFDHTVNNCGPQHSHGNASTRSEVKTGTRAIYVVDANGEWVEIPQRGTVDASGQSTYFWRAVDEQPCNGIRFTETTQCGGTRSGQYGFWLVNEDGPAKDSRYLSLDFTGDTELLPAGECSIVRVWMDRTERPSHPRWIGLDPPQVHVKPVEGERRTVPVRWLVPVEDLHNCRDEILSNDETWTWVSGGPPPFRVDTYKHHGEATIAITNISERCL